MILLGGALPIAIGLVVAFVSQALLARVVGPEIFGNYIYALTWASGAALLAKGGQEWVLLKVIPRCIPKGEWGQIRFTVERSFKIVARRATLWASFLALFGVATGRVSSLFLLTAAVALLVIFALAELRRSWALAHGAIWLSDAPESIVKSLALLFAALTMVSLGQSIDPAILLWINVIATALTSLLATVIFLWLKAPNLLHVVSVQVDTSDYDSVSRSMWLSTASNILLRSADVIVVGFVTDAVTTGVYAISTRIAILAAAPIMIFSRIAAPLISAAAASENLYEVRRISRRYVGLTGASSVLILLFFIVAGEPTIRLLFGAAYADAELAALILLMGNVATAVIGPANLLMAVTGGHAQNAVISVCSAAIGLFLLAVLTPIYGPLGAATAASLALVFKPLASAVWIKMKFGIDTTFLSIFHSIGRRK